MDKGSVINSESGIWSLETAKKRHRFDPSLAEGIVAIFKEVKSVADLGCGKGDYCKYLKERDISLVHGYEGTPDIQKIAVYDDIINLVAFIITDYSPCHCRLW